MPTRCPKCGAEVEDEWPVCRKCFEPVKRPGFFARLLNKLRPRRINVTISNSSTAVPGFTSRTISLRTNEVFKIRDAKTGEIREYRSLDELPEEFRTLIRGAEQGALTGKNTTQISWTDSSGTVHHCNSFDELPAEMRALYQKALAGKTLDEIPEKFRLLLRQAEETGFSAESATSITWTDPSGTVHQCNSIDELPPEMRVIYQKALGDKEKI